MQVQGNDIANRLYVLMKKTGYPIVQNNGQRKFGPPPDWSGPPPPRGCEVFVGNLPRCVFEDELVPIFSKVGKIYDMRLMMDFSGSNRGYAFVTYTTRADAAKAIKMLNNYEIQPRKHIGVVKSIDNCRLYIGNLPRDKTREEILTELTKHVSGVVDVVLYSDRINKNVNRGFAFVEFISHRAAAMARKILVPGCVKLWDRDISVDWADPEPDVDDEQMSRVKVLYVRNFEIRTTPETIQKVFESAINCKIQKVKKIYDYAFIHFYERSHAEKAMATLQHTEIDGSKIEISWSKPVDRELYKIQKIGRGNAKFNNNFNITQTMLLYKQHLDKKEYASSPRDEGIGSGSSMVSPCCSPEYTPTFLQEECLTAPANLEAICNRYMWAPPIYKYQRFFDAISNKVLWIGVVELPQVGLPVLPVPKAIGPIVGRPCLSVQQAQLEVAIVALNTLKMLQRDNLQMPQQQIYSQPIIQNMMPPCYNLPCDYMSPHFYTSATPTVPVSVPLW